MAATRPDLQLTLQLTSLRHARLYAGHPRLDGDSINQGVDGRNKSGHDDWRVSAAT